MKKILQQIFCTKLGWLFVCLILSVVFGVLANWYDWCQIAMYISLIYPVCLGIGMIIYAWFVNTLYDLFDND